MNELLLSLADELKGPGHWTREEAEAAERLIRSAVAENERLRDALQSLAGLMDYSPDAKFGCGNSCDGCQAEMVEASRIVSEALQ